MAELRREKDYVVRFDEVLSKLNNKSKEIIRDHRQEYLRNLDAVHRGYDHLVGDRRGSMPKNDVKFCVANSLGYKLHNGISVRYKHKDHDKKSDDPIEEEKRKRLLYPNHINRNIDDYEPIFEASMWSQTTDLFRNPIVIKL